jgi:hypothetical protein
MAERTEVDRAIRATLITPFAAGVIALIIRGLIILLIKIAPVGLVSNIDFELVELVIMAILLPLIWIQLYRSQTGARPAASATPGVTPNGPQSIDRQAEGVFKTQAGAVIILLHDGRIIVFAHGNYEFFPSAQEYRRATNDRAAWQEISDPLQRNTVLANARGVIQMATGTGAHLSASGRD